MCRADVAPHAAGPLAALLLDMAATLAKAAGVEPENVRIGPVDFGEIGGHAADLPPRPSEPHS
jgi:hypothetical protein